MAETKRKVDVEFEGATKRMGENLLSKLPHGRGGEAITDAETSHLDARSLG